MIAFRGIVHKRAKGDPANGMLKIASQIRRRREQWENTPGYKEGLASKRQCALITRPCLALPWEPTANDWREVPEGHGWEPTDEDVCHMQLSTWIPHTPMNSPPNMYQAVHDG